MGIHSVKSDELGFLGFWSWDMETGTIEASPELNRLFAIDPCEDKRRPSIEDYEGRIHPDDLEWVRRERPRSFGPSGWGVLEYRVIDAAGEIHWVMCRATYDTDFAGNVLRCRGMLMDVTAFKQDGNSVRIAPAPLADPVQSLVDSALDAYHAAQQVNDDRSIDLLQGVLLSAGKLLARQIADEHPFHS